ncbi:UDP-N-acetylmuramate:L-alanyl-gamma-D-glutamyl-meso-diaminopimelate ligase [Allochromatium vinosum]|uniref:UDP-N-acetylmuramate--L-alanyl-gamma-D-glutamyl-meso-2,6-diaminoheptandioate ligase n=1 Tax=Allochromatium vinosum (strain ATCC 17899 / DSM 180 / NBRC 103801 / NCIMB 10441 / D) TaxID=572477 RepID=D3RRX3_ALLVD|nr:UDP-N-acetylmuramate:L-alanyl-gamma-D-glutamyl-meso-diaminopimelate ligase [Allochromatium vinosum]ADC62027.1 UDP-N-acetylmuramate [Allochromatium vinosum DSM 180]
MHLHILGICGTFMGGIALLARALGHRVTGSDANVYPPMSTQLEAAGIELMEGYDAAHLDPPPDVVVVGNAMKRGIPAVEAMLDRDMRYCSGPEWLRENLLRERWVLAVSGTHGKTTTASMLAWVLEDAGLDPGFLIGGVPLDFGVSARLGSAPFFVVEADEYDTAFFDKRSKFVHYGPRTLILNNLEFDHADIFDDLGQIQRQFHHLIRTVPGSGLIVHPARVPAVDTVIGLGCWTPRETFGAEGDWRAELIEPDGSRFRVWLHGAEAGVVDWGQSGLHNVENALAVLAAARHAGVPVGAAVEALGRFQGVKRRLEVRGEVAGIRVFDDFAHHPTAIATTLDGLRRRVGAEQRILAVLEPRSNTMRLGTHNAELAGSLTAADRVYVHAPSDLGWDAAAVLAGLGERLAVHDAIEPIVTQVIADSRPGDQILVMSNGGFGGIHQRLLDALRLKHGA